MGPYKFEKLTHIRKVISITVLVAFMFSTVRNPVYAQLASGQMSRLPALGVMVHLSPEFTPAHLKGIIIHPENALKFDFIIYKGDQILSNQEKKSEYTKLIKYFLASLAVPDDNQWVNLSPYEKNRIIKEDFGRTEMGRDLLAQDYMLKEVTASLIYPQDKLGQEFWNKVYAKSYQQFGTTNVPINTFNKVWIVPDDAEVFEKGNMAYVVKNHLKVMLEEDYLSLNKHNGIQTTGIRDKNKTHAIGSQIVREVVLPALEREVNEGKNFAPLRQVFSGVVLAAWYKRALKDSFLGKVYMNKSRLKGVDQDPKNDQIIYEQYLKAFKKGVFNFIKEDIDKYSHETIPRKYFSGGALVMTPLTRGGALKVVPATSAQLANAAMDSPYEDMAEAAVKEAGLDAAMSLHYKNAAMLNMPDSKKLEIFQYISERWKEIEWDGTILNDQSFLVGERTGSGQWRFRSFHPEANYVDRRTVYRKGLVDIAHIRKALEQGQDPTEDQLKLLKAVVIGSRLRGLNFTLYERQEKTFPETQTGARAFAEFGVDSLDKLMDKLELIIINNLLRQLKIEHQVDSMSEDEKESELKALEKRLVELAEPYLPPEELVSRIDFSKLPISYRDVITNISQERSSNDVLRKKVMDIGKRENLIGHGVDGKRKGLMGLINIALEGQIRTYSQEWYVGILSDGNSEHCAGPHGPYYAVLQKDVNGRPSHQVDFSDFLVPNKLAKEFAIAVVHQAFLQRIITAELESAIIGKFRTYEDFILLHPEGVQEVNAAMAMRAEGQGREVKRRAMPDTAMLSNTVNEFLTHLSVLGKSPSDINILGLSSGDAQDEMHFAQQGYHVVASDLDVQKMQKNIRRSQEENLSFEGTSINVTQRLPFEDEKFDAIYYRLGLHYLTNEQIMQLSQELHRVVKKGGIIYIVAKSKDDPYYHDFRGSEGKDGMVTYLDPVDKKSYKRNFLNELDLRKLFLQFHVVSVTKHSERLYTDQHDSELITLLAAKGNAQLSNQISNKNAFPGGIDVNAANWNLRIKHDANGVALPLAWQDMAQLSRLEGLEPDITKIQPAVESSLLSRILKN
ncbi:MAG: class I SAM-dependent methyltransferase [Candidatus Omnitrophica bacterium]|nr:class I SAM-dependent methyltransferase [Candidatus Omnitrophota bacterium]